MTNPASIPRPNRVPASRLSRLARLGSMASGVASDMAVNGLVRWTSGERPALRDLLLTPRNVRRIANDLAQMRGAAMKMGQLLSMETGDMLPPELADILARLRADADFMPPKQLRGMLNAVWGEGWLKHFHRFDVRPIAAASIGQVHRARLKDGRDVAIKVQYPSVARSIDSDVSNVGALIRLSGLLPQELDLKPYLSEARRQLHEEADYLREAACLQQFKGLLEGDNNFMLPELHADWTSQTVLAMSFVPGDPIESVVDLPQADRDRVAALLIELVLRELFQFGVMQTDPNFANYRYDGSSGRIVLLDFGAARYFGPEIVRQYAELIGCGLGGDRAGLTRVADEIGFISTNMSGSDCERIVAMIAFVFQEVAGKDVYDFARPELTQTLNEQGTALAEDGVTPPAVPMDALYLQRKFAGTFLLAHRLRARVRVREMLTRFVGGQGGS